MIDYILSFFRCRHRTISRVFTNHDTGRSHVVCMDCCGRFAYNWATMELGERIDADGHAAETITDCPVTAARRAM